MPEYRKPTAIEQAFNSVYGFLAGLGLGSADSYLLEVRGRKSGKVYRTPVYVMDLGGKRYLVAPRGYTQWVRNAEAAGEIALKRRGSRQTFRLRPISDADKPEILKAYLDRFASTVQAYFEVQSGSPPEAFVPIARDYPVFELL